jgi:NADH dehydrogenase FAD-containing subunit
VETDEFAAELPEAPTFQRRKRKLVLIGAGQAHLQILDWWREQPIRGVELTLISAFPTAIYGELLPAVLAGMVPRREVEIDLHRLTRRSGADLVVDKVVRLDPETRAIDLAVHPEQTFDAASINIGAVHAREDLCQTHRTLVSTQPMVTFLSRFEHRLQELLQQSREAPGPDPLQLAVVGGSALGVEFALCLQERSRRERWHAKVRLIDAQSELLSDHAARTGRLVRRLFRDRRIFLNLRQPVVDCEDDGPAELVLDNGERIRNDLAIWTAGTAPPTLLSGFQLPKTKRGYLGVRSTLQSTGDAPVFAVGNVAEVGDGPGSRARCNSSLQAAVLWENLQQFFRDGELAEFDPPQASPSYLCCGDGTSIFNYRSFAVRSAWMWRLQQRRDRQFLERFQ